MTLVVADPPTTASAMNAHARVHTVLESDASGPRSRLAVLRSQAPLSLRPTIGAESKQWEQISPRLQAVCLTAAAAGPVGGDALSLEVKVGAGSALLLTEASATLVLPSRDGATSVRRVRVQVEKGGTFIWMAKPMIAVRGCDHVNNVDVDASESARILIGEQFLLGRKNEDSGRVRHQLRVRRGGRSIHVQSLNLGGPTGQGPAVVGDNRAVGSLLLLDETLVRCEPTLLEGDAALMPLAAEGAVTVTAMARDNTGLRRQFLQAMDVLGSPWNSAGLLRGT